MTIQALTRALSVLTLLVPVAAGAHGGSIRFSGAIVQPAECKAEMKGNTARSGSPRERCREIAGQPAIPAEARVQVSTRASSSARGPDGGPRRHLVVTLEYR